MEKDENPESSNNISLITISDILGIKKPGTELIRAISRGIGNVFDPLIRKRNANTDIEIFEKWKQSLAMTESLPSSFELSLGERASIRLASQESRRQFNREKISSASIQEYRELNPIDVESSETSSTPMSDEWIDYYWDKAQDISDERLHSIWGRILARQASRQRSYSMRMLDMTRTLSASEALSLEHIAKYAASIDCMPQHGTGTGLIFGLVHHVLGSRAQSIDTDKLNELNKRIFARIGNYHRELFGSIGFYIEDGWAYEFCGLKKSGILTISIANKKINLSGFLENYDDQNHFRRYANFGHGIQISPLGCELLDLTRRESDDLYIEDLCLGFELQGLTAELAS